MLGQQDYKVVLLNSDFTVDNAAFTTSEIDTKGYRYCTILAAAGNVPANVASMTVTESDTTGSNHAAFITFGTTANIAGSTSAVFAASGGDGTVKIIEIDLRGRKRFLDFTCTAGDGSATVTELCAIAILWNPESSPITATERGASEIIRV